MEVKLQAIAFVKNIRTTPIDDNWKNIISNIELAQHIPTEAFNHIEDFSHLEIIYYLNQVNPQDIIFSGHPRGKRNYPSVGILAQRKKDRPNTLGLATVEFWHTKVEQYKSSS